MIVIKIEIFPISSKKIDLLTKSWLIMGGNSQQSKITIYKMVQLY